MDKSTLSNIKIKRFSGEELSLFIPDLANLRIKVFFDFPYLYNGDFEYEKKYLKVYEKNPASVVVIAFDGKKVVGASTGMPLIDETNEVKKPFIFKNIDLNEVFYFGESVLLKEYRGLGIGKAFFKEREAHALFHNYKKTAFCGVIRPTNHPLKPKDYRPLDSFWIKMGYKKQPDMVAEFEWLDRDQLKPDNKPLVFWLKNH